MIPALRTFSSRYLYYDLFQRWRQPMRVAARQELMANLKRSPAEIEEIQSQKLSRLVRHAYDHVPYYRGLFDDLGLQPSDIRSSADLSRLPLLTKAIIREQWNNLQSTQLPPECGGTRVRPTGGSSGEPLSFILDDRSWAVGTASVERGYAMAGWSPGDRVALLWGRYLDTVEHRTLQHRLIDWGINQLFLDSYGVTQEEMAHYGYQLQQFRPALLVGFVSSLVVLAQIIRDRGITGIQPGAIITTAETLLPAQRRLIEETFQCAIFDRYGAQEAHNVAQEGACHAGLHLFTDLQVVEFLADDGSNVVNQPGHIVITNLDTYAMPLIRYTIGDVGTRSTETCSCGVPFPLMSSLQGRVSDIITTPSGRLVHGFLFDEVLDVIPGVRRYQVVQETIDELTIRLVRDEGFDSASVSTLETMIHRHADPNFRVTVQFVNEIEAGASGKYQFIISKVPTALDGVGRDTRV